MISRSLNHSVYCHQYHLVWGTKWRRQFLQEYVKNEFVIYVKRFVARYPTLHLRAVNTDKDHVHIQMEIPPNIAVSKVVQKLKIETSKNIKKRFKFVREMYLERGVWAVGFFSSTLGLNDEMIEKYIAYQGRQNKEKQVKLLNI
ncbi:MAG: hypothetical protein UX02_C0009G0003 [Candidatus Moranbacteria bacterium GW2011_GWC1_45_18]|uniref:Transposase n=1 Tax=Candidatus Collierbacteria bacterium GW2011_GWB1_44_6 TaxID=1618384 RepID=A0A0G1MJZ5_9BACT|nr:MAG: Transposase [Candidatus Collierbacteria bacterium GW2011_GWB1_44_6]KKT98971.1 MAG: hypothetical protein UX02_C0009G0003 [Candidatus Moranbacteria bacterium GW2011_GWC1_45_18]